MAELFDNAKRQLQAGGEPGPHPDAEILNAYMEDALSERERAPLVEHLSRCAACREIVALAAPPVAAPPRATSLKDPAVRLALWRWAMVAVTAVVVIGAVLTKTGPQLERPAPEQEIAAPAPSSNAQTVEAKQQPAIAEKKSAPAPARKDETVTAKAVPQHAPAPAAPQPSGEAFGRNVAALDRATINAAAPAAPMMRDSNEALKKSEAYSATAAPPPPPPQPIEHANAPAGAEVAAGAAKRKAVPMMAVRAQAATVAEVTSATRWTVSGEGVVQRSTDAGRTWQPVRVADGVRFRTVAAVGEDVWAGGANGALYRSADDGQTWSMMRVWARPRGNRASIPNIALSGDIVRITLHDPGHVELLTSNGQAWSTSDGGKTWQLR